MKLVLSIFLIFSFSFFSKASAEVPDSKLSQLTKLSDYCIESRKDDVKKDYEVRCFFNKITKKKVDNFLNSKKKVDYLVISSLGGDVAASLKLGLRISHDKTHVVIKGNCFSSCVNYILPAAHKVSVLPGSLVAMHGSVPRSFREFASIRLKQYENADAHKLEQIRPEWSTLRDGVLKQEQNFFDMIYVDHAYVTRYNELLRTFIVSTQHIEKSSNRSVLFIDKNYLSHFGIHVDYWDEENYENYLKLRAPYLFKGRNILFGILGLPIRISE